MGSVSSTKLNLVHQLHKIITKRVVVESQNYQAVKYL